MMMSQTVKLATLMLEQTLEGILVSNLATLDETGNFCEGILIMYP